GRNVRITPPTQRGSGEGGPLGHGDARGDEDQQEQAELGREQGDDGPVDNLGRLAQNLPGGHAASACSASVSAAVSRAGSSFRRATSRSRNWPSSPNRRNALAAWNRTHQSRLPRRRSA